MKINWRAVELIAQLSRECHDDQGKVMLGRVARYLLGTHKETDSIVGHFIQTGVRWYFGRMRLNVVH